MAHVAAQLLEPCERVGDQHGDAARHAPRRAGGRHDVPLPKVTFCTLSPLHDLHDNTSTLTNCVAIAQELRIDSRTASFCVEMAGHDDLWADRHGDQGLVFFAPNQTWAQPPYYVHKMITESDLDVVVRVVTNSSLDVIAQSSTDGSKMTLRVTNSQPLALTARVSLGPLCTTQCAVVVTTLAAPNADYDAGNPATDPQRITPQTQHVVLTNGAEMTFGGVSFTTIQIS